jgi:hypothetical protein
LELIAFDMAKVIPVDSGPASHRYAIFQSHECGPDDATTSGA